MKFKNNIWMSLSVFLLSTIIFSGCNDDLNTFPETQLSDAAFWNSTNDLKLVCNYNYSFLSVIGDNFSANWSDDGFGYGTSPISDGSRQAESTSIDWNNNYKMIRNCNNLLENVYRVKDDAAMIERYKGEARYFRALAYFELVKRFGDVPLILKTYDVFDELAQTPRSPREQILDSVYIDLDYAIAKLPVASKLASTEYGRITSGAALALKARIGLFEGTWNKFHQQGSKEKHLNIAIAASEILMNSGEYSLYRHTAKPDSSYYFLFHYIAEGPANKENILVRLYGQDIKNSISSHNYSGLLDGGYCTATRAFLDAYLYKDGLPIDKSPYFKPQENTLTEFENRDPRAGMTVFNKTHWYVSSMYKPNFSAAPSGYKLRKYFIVADYVPRLSYIDNILIRYSEVLLTYAEAKFELNGTISDADLEKSINLIRTRVNMPKLTNAFITANGLNMQTEIRRERRVELAYECGHRYWDLIRWKTAQIELPKALLGAKYFPDEHVGVTSLKLTPEGIVIVQAATTRSFNPERDYLWPLPTRDLGLNLKLTQNPNW